MFRMSLRALHASLILTASIAGGTAVAQVPVDPWADSFRPLPFHQMARQVEDRYDARLIGAETRPPRPDERDAGVQLIYRFRLLTQAGQVLNIRLDARTGRFLEVAGAGQIAARRPHSP